ncbi:MAG TPA: Kdo hydroxylase family protein [Burkholderiales bacterium]|nr:Kdo hydroxylase family protein [Burkholderiales bacterium]
MNDVLLTLPFTDWTPAVGPQLAAQATAALERGGILFLPQLAFETAPEERRLIDPRWLDGKAKNISYDARNSEIRHTSAADGDRAALAALLARFSRQARTLLLALCPHYSAALEWGLTSFRPAAVEGRPSSDKKDDSRLHIDAFASRPNQGRRILRMFCNLNPRGEPRAWNVGEPFEDMARRFRDRVPPQWPGSAQLLAAFGITRGRRSAYDHIMLNLHDRAKLDFEYQRSSPRQGIEFPAGSTWIVYTDRVMHAALRGQFMLEQTFYLPVAAMQEERYAPLRVLEQLWQRPLA